MRQLEGLSRFNYPRISFITPVQNYNVYELPGK